MQRSNLAWERKEEEISNGSTSCLAVMVWSSEDSLMFFRQPEQMEVATLKEQLKLTLA